MNWGKGITIALVAFIGFIVFLGVTLMSKNVDLVSEDYYQQEINYEDQINAKVNASKLTKSITVDQDEDFLIVSIPEGAFEHIELFLKRPNNDKKDLSFKISDTRTYLIEKSKLTKGNYNARINFLHEKKECQVETSIYINK